MQEEYGVKVEECAAKEGRIRVLEREVEVEVGEGIKGRLLAGVEVNLLGEEN